MRIFISGPITGKPDYNREAFNDAEQKLSALGHAVWNPVRLHPDKPDRFKHHDYLWVCFSMIERSDVVVMLPGWADSKGAQHERRWAIGEGKQVMSLYAFLEQKEDE